MYVHLRRADDDNTGKFWTKEKRQSFLDNRAFLQRQKLRKLYEDVVVSGTLPGKRRYYQS